MTSLHISRAKDDFYNLANSCIKFGEVVNINTENGNVIMIREADYKSLLESLYLVGIKGVYGDIENVAKMSSSNFSKKAPWN